MCCCLTPCEQWKLQRRGYVPMDIYNGQGSDSCCEHLRSCFGCSNCSAEEDTANIFDTDCCCR